MATQMDRYGRGWRFRWQAAWAIGCILITALAVTLPAHASWPTDPASPLVLGEADIFSGFEHATVTTPDGASWVAWVDFYCLGQVMIQRIAPDGTLLAPGGIVIEDDPSCGVTTAPILVACADNSVVISRRMGQIDGEAVMRISHTGEMMWNDGIVIDPSFGSISDVLPLADGDVLVAWHANTNVYLGRFTAEGDAVWKQPATIPTGVGSNINLFAAVSDGGDGAYVFWTSHVSYGEIILAARFTAAGEAAWDEALWIVLATFEASLHTEPAAIEDGAGGAVLVWTDGQEQPHVPSPLFMQRIDAAGSLLLQPQGTRISTELTRQFDPILNRDEATNDILITWRDGFLETQEIRVQRMSLHGERRWGDAGATVTPLNVHASEFSAAWNSSMLAIAVNDEPDDPESAAVRVHQVDGFGDVGRDAWPISPPSERSQVHLRSVDDDAFVVTWFQTVPDAMEDVAAQRVNSDGTLGIPPVAGDIDGDGDVDFDDFTQLLASWGDPGCGGPPDPPGMPCPADLDGDGDVDFDDFTTLLANWSA